MAWAPIDIEKTYPTLCLFPKLWVILLTKVVNCAGGASGKF